MHARALHKQIPEIAQPIQTIQRLNVTPVADISQLLHKNSIRYIIDADPSRSEDEAHRVKQSIVDDVLYLDDDNVKIKDWTDIVDQNQVEYCIHVRLDRRKPSFPNRPQYDEVGDWVCVDWDDDRPDVMLEHNDSGPDVVLEHSDSGVICGLSDVLDHWHVDIWASDGTQIHSVELGTASRAEIAAGVWMARYPYQGVGDA